MLSVYDYGSSFEKLQTYPHIDYTPDASAVGIWYKHQFKRIPKKLDLVMVSENVRAIISAVKQDLGVAMIPKYLILKELEKGSIVQLPLHAKPLSNTMLLIQHQSKIPTKAEKIFLSMIRSKKNLVF